MKTCHLGVVAGGGDNDDDDNRREQTRMTVEMTGSARLQKRVQRASNQSPAAL